MKYQRIFCDQPVKTVAFRSAHPYVDGARPRLVINYSEAPLATERPFTSPCAQRGPGLLLALLLFWATAAQADVYQRIPLADPAFVPRGPASDSLNKIYVSGVGQNGGVVQRLAPENGYAAAETLPFGTLTNPAGIAWQAGTETVYVLDQRPGGSVVLALESGSSTPITLPFGTLSADATQIAVDNEGDVFVAEDAEHKVLELEHGAGAPVTIPFTGLEGADGLAAYDSTVTVADQTAGKIVNYDVSSNTQSETPIPAGTVPGPIAYNHYGFLHVFDRSSGNVVEVFGPGEELTLHAGSPGGRNAGIAALGQGGDSGAFFVTGAPTQGLWENVDTNATPPKIRSPYLDVGDSKIDVPLSVNDPHNIIVPFTYEEIAEPRGNQVPSFTVLSSNPSILPASGVTISRVGVGNEYTMSFEPLAPGRAQLTLEVAISPGVSYLSLLGTQAVEPSVGPEPRNTDQRFLAQHKRHVELRAIDNDLPGTRDAGRSPPGLY